LIAPDLRPAGSSTKFSIVCCSKYCATSSSGALSNRKLALVFSLSLIRRAHVSCGFEGGRGRDDLLISVL
jgi:hypothetical protein